jgi:DNA-binding response OmpR family regulator
MCVLIVEDEVLIRDILVEALRSHGHEVCEAQTGDDAAVLIKNPPTAFTLLITDIHIPGQQNGVEIGRLMRQHRPSLPIIYTTGRPDALAAIGPLGPKDAVVLKPFTPTQIVDVVRRLLAH